MTLDDINRMGVRVYRDPTLAIVMRDALEDLGIRWEVWMEQSGTLDRLAECMIVALAGRLSASDNLREYATECGIIQGDVVRLKHIQWIHYIALARAFLMPPVLVEVQASEIFHAVPGVSEYTYAWRPPSPELARAVLCMAHQFTTLRKDLDEAGLSLQITRGKFFDELGETVRGHHPEARGYQLCCGARKWVSRRPAAWNPPDAYNSYESFDD